MERHNPAATEGLPLTGERTVPGIPEENYWFRRHEAAYEFALRWWRDGRCSRSAAARGTARLCSPRTAASRARHRLRRADGRARARRLPAARFVRANLAALPVPSGSVDVVATLQVIEHVWNHGEFVRECLRVLRPGGLFVRHHAEPADVLARASTPRSTRSTRRSSPRRS